MLEIAVIPDLESNYHPGIELSLKSVFMQPYMYHSNFLFHSEFDGDEIDVCSEEYDFYDFVDENGERASFTQATNVPWTLEVQNPRDADDLTMCGKITGPDGSTCVSYLNCATPLIINLGYVDGICGITKYNIELT